MKGALVIGGTQASGTNTGLGDTLAIGGGLGLVGVLRGMFALGTRSKTRKHGNNSTK